AAELPPTLAAERWLWRLPVSLPHSTGGERKPAPFTVRALSSWEKQLIVGEVEPHHRGVLGLDRNAVGELLTEQALGLLGVHQERLLLVSHPGERVAFVARVARDALAVRFGPNGPLCAGVQNRGLELVNVAVDLIPDLDALLALHAA